MQAENEAAVQQIKRLKLEHVHSQQQLAQENVRLQRTLAQIQVSMQATVHLLKRSLPQLNLYSVVWRPSHVAQMALH